jgi:hypothetical protein|tara:strand:- start:191 stop:733 length:543 start_codon:yes stop_codon:yes gene_type:complete
MNDEYYDWNSLISDEARLRMCKDIKSQVDADNYSKDLPKFQVMSPFKFGTEDWTNLSMSFIWSCFAYLKREVSIKQVQSWSYMTSLKYPEERDILWHHHNRSDTTHTVSGVYYLHLPKDINLHQAGTEMAPQGPEADPTTRYFAEAKIGNWIIYPGKQWHRPGVVQSQEDRFIVAADMEF